MTSFGHIRYYDTLGAHTQLVVAWRSQRVDVVIRRDTGTRVSVWWSIKSESIYLDYFEVLTLFLLWTLPVELSVINKIQELGFLLEVHRQVGGQNCCFNYPHYIFVIAGWESLQMVVGNYVSCVIKTDCDWAMWSNKQRKYFNNNTNKIKTLSTIRIMLVILENLH